MADWDHFLERLHELNRRAWEHGAVRGFDVSRLTEAMERWQP